MEYEHCYCPIKIAHSHMTDKSCDCEFGRELPDKVELDSQLERILFNVPTSVDIKIFNTILS